MTGRRPIPRARARRGEAVRAAAPVLALLVPASVAAAPAAPPGPPSPGLDGGARGHDVVLVDEPPPPRTDAAGPDALYLNRCAAGCTVEPGGNDARADRSSIPATRSTLSPFGYADAVWDAVVACVRDTYLPYGVEVVTVEPAAGDYVEVMVAGVPAELGQPGNILGIAPMSSSCAAGNRWIAFAFANAHGVDPVLELCATVAHEAGHVYGLDHAYDCRDPMTYLTGCGQKFFVNRALPCGEFDGARGCRCGATQNSHVVLGNALGLGTLPPPAEVTIPYPATDAAVADRFAVFAEVDERRLTDRVELWLNGWPWATLPGIDGDAPYGFRAPAELPDGVIDVEVRAYNDLEVPGVATLTVVKGAPCTSGATCLDGQRCDDGRCAWPAPTGGFGDACALDADCVSRRCETDGEVALCTEACTPGLDATCGDGYGCLQTGDAGACWPADRLGDGGGCCSAGGGAGSSALLALAAALGLGRRRRLTSRGPAASGPAAPPAP